MADGASISPVCCGPECAAHLLHKVVDGTPAYSDVTSKRRYRSLAADLVVANPSARPVVFGPDHQLPRSAEDPQTTTYLVEDLCADPRLAGRFEPCQFFSPNVDASVVIQPRSIPIPAPVGFGTGQ